MTSLRTILQSTKLQDYILKTSTFPREHEQLKCIRDATLKKFGDMAILSVPPDEGQFLSMLLKLMNAKRALEIGVFTGYSLLATALALPEDGKVTAIDISREAYEVGLPFIRNAKMEHKIDFIHSDAVSALDKMLNDLRNGEMEPYDFIFIDADKELYPVYHEKAMELVRVGGVIAYDNTLWLGYVAEVDESNIQEDFRGSTEIIKELNKFIASDSRVEISQVSIGDGLTLCRRIV